MDITNKHIIVVGLGKSGVATVSFLIKRGARVTAMDTATDAELGDRITEIRELGAVLELGPHRIEIFESADGVVLSPGVPHTLAPFEAARRRGIPVIGEVELACRFIDEPIIAVTGTNGKTTATTLLGEMMTQSGIDTFVGGNIGSPLIGYADRKQKCRWVVAEISSFQLDTIEAFHPRVAVLLNLAEDHLDRYENFEAYVKSKARLFCNQNRDDVAILNGGSSLVTGMQSLIKSRIVYFKPGETLDPSQEGAVIGADRIVVQTSDTPVGVNGDTKGMRTWIIERSDIHLVGRHNLENIAAAALAATAGGGTPDGIRKAVRRFKGLAHRLEFVGRRNEVQFVNDSKATNVDAVVRALDAFTTPVVLILGGRNKGADLRSLENSVRRKVRAVIAMGEARHEVMAALGETVPVTPVETMAAAFSQAAAAALPGDTVLLSPACASFDMYENYARRGDDFRRAFSHLNPNSRQRTG